MSEDERVSVLVDDLEELLCGYKNSDYAADYPEDGLVERIEELLK